MVERWTRERRREHTRELLLDAAEHLFASRGFEGASLDEIADAAGYTRGAIYKHFGSKPDLFMEVNRRFNERFLAGFLDLIDPETPPEELDLTLIAKRWHELQSRDAQAFALGTEFNLYVLRHPEVRERVAEQRRGVAMMIARFMDEQAVLLGARLRIPSLTFSPPYCLDYGLTFGDMSFAVPADAYDRFMGRYSGPLAPLFADFAGVVSGRRVLDVGCGPGALTAELVSRVGSPSVAAVEPSDQFVAAARARHPEVDVRQASAEQLPFEDRVFDVALAQLVVHFMRDPVGGIREMARVTQESGTVAACVWDHGGGAGPLSLFWSAVRETDPDADDESHLPGSREGDLAELFGAAGLHAIESWALSITVEHATFEDWWEPFTLGVGPAGRYVAGLDDAQRIELRERCRDRTPPAPFEVTAAAWAARGVV
jgi:AcrR family transcriptional regulator